MPFCSKDIKFPFSICALSCIIWSMMKNFKTIRSGITITTITLCIVISIAVSAVSYSFYYQTVKRDMIHQTEASLTLLAASIDSNIADAYSFIRSCRTSSSVMNYLQSSETRTSRIAAYNYLKDSYNSYNGRYYIKRVFIASYGRNDFVQVGDSTGTHLFQSADDVESQYFFDDYYAANTYLYTEGILKTATGRQYLPVVRPLYSTYSSDELGFIYMEISPNVVTIPLKTAGTYGNEDYFLTLGKHHYQYRNYLLTDCDLSCTVTGDLSDTASYPGTMINEIRNERGTYISVSVPLAAKDCYITQLMTAGSFYEQLLTTITIILLCSVVTGILLHSILNRMVNVPVFELQKRMKRISEGNFERDSSIEWEHELGDIGRSINDLAEDVRVLLEQKVKDEHEKREYEYKMLQSQINPHFLYNTLNSIKWMATIQNAPGIAEMTTALSRLLKSIAKGTEKAVPISAEISLLDDYFTIQKYRYGGTVGMTYQIDDEDALSCLIPRFTLQPIVENAIFHGIEPKGAPGTITVHIFKKDDAILQIDITDDGVGMTAEQASLLLTEKSSGKADFFKEIGVNNVHKRLQYEFGASYGLRIDSRLSEYTTISILLPYRPG